MKLIKLIVLAALIITIGSCHKDIDEDIKTITPTITPNILSEVTSDILGYVYDENNQPVENAKVSLYSSTTTTDKYGVFHFESVKLDKLGTYIKVNKSGYLLGSDKIYPDKGLSLSYIHLYNLDKTGEFSSKQGGTINIANGGKIVFSPNSIVNQDGTSYTGNVVVTAKRLDTNDENIGDKMPGALVGEDINGNTSVLGTIGMIAVELRDPSGNELNIKSGAAANITLPVSSNQVANIPDEIPLWYFDEDRGLWIEEGKAIYQDGNYIADLAHFSWWNLDAKFDPIYMCVKVLFENGKPAVGYSVTLTADVIYPTSYGRTDENGQVCGLVPKGKEMVINVINPFCNTVEYTKTIGPFDTDVTLNDIILPYNYNLGNGKVECNGETVDNAIVIIDYTSSSFTKSLVIPTIGDGNFDLNFSLNNCDIITSATIFAYNPTTGDASHKIDLNINNTNNDILINICHNCDFEVNLNANYGVLCDINTLSLEAVVSNTGNYSYLWSNGETGKSIDYLEPSLYCVTVTNIDEGCDVVKCITVYEGPLTINTPPDFQIAHPYCDFNNGSFTVEAFGGVEPYTCTVTGPNGYTFSTNEKYFNLENLEAGTYTTTLVDGGGCTKTTETKLINDKYHKVNVDYSNGIGCDSAYIIASVTTSNPTGLTYTWSNGQEGSEILVKTSGQYCVTVSEGIDCVIDTCIDIVILNTTPLNTSCNKNLYEFSFEGYTLVETKTNFYSFNSTDIFSFDVLKDDYRFWYNFAEANCIGENKEMSLPHLTNGIKIDSIRNASCGGCKDGQIFFTINSGNYCRDCEYGNTAIYSIDDLETDLTSDNNAGTLGNGYYYVVVTDANTGCFIGHKKVHISTSISGSCLTPELSEGVVAFYPFSNGSYEDFSGNNHHLNAESQGQNIPVSTDDRNGNSNCAFNFVQGIEPAYFISENPLQIPDDFTLSLWYQPLGDPGNYETLFSIGYWQDGGMALGLYDCRKAVFRWTNECWDNEDYFGCSIAINNHDWHHLVATFDLETSEMKLYRNGVLQDVKTQPYFNIISEGLLQLGNDFNGKLDDIILYNRVLEQDDINDLFNLGTCCE